MQLILISIKNRFIYCARAVRKCLGVLIGFRIIIRENAPVGGHNSIMEMYMPKFFIDDSQIKNNAAFITGGDVVHITRVLRMRPGGLLTVCDGVGSDYDARISEVTQTEVAVEILRKYPCEAEPKTEVVLFQALPKQGKMEYIIQKNTELGVSEIVPVYSKRCVVKPSDKTERWQKIALEAAKQCGRGMVPKISGTISFEDAMNRLAALEAGMVFYEEEHDTRLKELIEGKKIKQAGLFIGPEGGLAPEEAELARELKIPTVTLGNRILRTETAGAAVLPIIMYSQNDI